MEKGTVVLTYEDTGAGVRTTCRGAAGSVVVFLHNDRGHLVSRTVEVTRDARFAADLPAMVAAGTASMAAASMARATNRLLAIPRTTH